MSATMQTHTLNNNPQACVQQCSPVMGSYFLLLNLVFSRRASAAVNHLKRFHEKKRRGPKPYSLYLDHILHRTSPSPHKKDQHQRPHKDIYIMKVHKLYHCCECQLDLSSTYLDHFTLKSIERNEKLVLA